MRRQATGNAGMARERQRGLTLIEVMTVVAILGIIAGIAWSAYDSQRLKGYRSDAVIALTTMAQREERYMTENGSYTDNIDKLDTDLDKKSPKLHYQLSVAIPGTTGCTVSVGGTNRYYCYVLTATAIAAQAADTKCATLTLDQTGRRGATGGGTDCWSK